MKSFLKSEVAMVAWRLGLMYIILTLCQLVFYLYNQSLIEGLTAQEIMHLIPGAFKFGTPSILYVNSLWILLSLIPIRSRAKSWYRKGLYWIYMVTNAAGIIAINLADTVYFRYTQKRISMEELLFADNDNSLELMGEFALENWRMILFMIVMIYALSKAYLKGVESPSIPKNSCVYYPIHTLALAFVAFLIMGGIRGGLPLIHKDTRPISPANATIYTTDMAKVNWILSNPFCIIRSIGHTAPRDVVYFDQAKADSLFTPYHFPAKYIQDSTVRYKDYNVVVVIMESFSAENSAFLAPQLYEDEEKGYMPFLDSLMCNGLVMKQMHANGTRSIQAMPAVLGSMPSLVTSFVSMPQAMGESRHLPKMLRDKGYTTSFFCGSSRHSMGFAAYATMAGTEILKSREDYEAKHGKDDFDKHWGIWDEPFLQFLGEEVSEMKEPFMASIFTLSAHHPFSIPEQYADILPKGRTKVQPGTAYDDMAFRKFFERYSKEEWFNRTIFVFTADHVSSEKMSGKTRQYPGNHHTVGFIYTPDGSLKGEVNDITQQLDIMPTVLGLIGNKEPFFAFGRDILNEPERPKWSMVYSGDFIANTNDGVISIKNSDTLKAAIQQYYHHVDQQSYIVKEDSDNK